MKVKLNNKWRNARPANGRRRQARVKLGGFLTEAEQREVRARVHAELDEYAKRVVGGVEPVEPEGSHEPTADQVTMNGRFGCE